MHNNTAQWFSGTVRAALAAALLLCAWLAPAQAQERERTRLALQVQAAADVNPDAALRASPIKVRIYELKDSQVFLEADYFSLDEKDKLLLANDVLVREEFILRPGESRRIERKSHPAAQYLGVLAGYRDLLQSSWRVVHKLPEAPEAAWYRALVPAQKVALIVELQAQGIVLTAAP
ncbi:type VI secretion system lipoprotein TssJ [Roseateles sp. BYS180W]|uniref:Type VI secretion system lipoprotein TssJ n=1 Tax=Roseateles rivi TaxID=3299028 RepID=A0ABW7FSY3_9BURK